MQDYYYCILTGASPLQHNQRKVPLTNFRANVVEISGPVALFWSSAIGWSSAIWCTTSRADTLLQDNEFFSVSIILYDLLAFSSFYKILKNSSCGAVNFFRLTRV